MKEGHKERLEALASRKDDLLTISEIGIDQIIVDEAQEFRKLSFATNMTSLRGVDPNGSQRAWDLYVKSRFVDMKNPGRALVLASGTPITNTLGEMFTVQRLMDHAALRERGLHEFDAWASTFGDTSTELELQPSGKYRPVTRFAQFVNVPELIAMFRSFADVVLPEDLRDFVKVPAIAGGKRQIITAEPTPAFKAYQRLLDERITAIEERDRAPEPGDDILLSVITDGRHAAIDLRLVDPAQDNEAGQQAQRARRATPSASGGRPASTTYRRKDGQPFEKPGAGQLIFSDLGTISVEATRGFSAYRWIRNELVRLGVPASEIAYMQDFKKSEAKQRLFNDFNAGKVRFLIGSSDTMGTGVNVQLRLKALHHLDVPWLPSQIEQREGRIVRQGNQHDEVDIFAYATLGIARRHHVAEQRAQGPLHRRRALRRYERPPPRRPRRGPGEPVRDGQGDRVRRSAPDAEGGARGRDRSPRTAARRPYRRSARHPPADSRRRARDRALDAPHRRDRRRTSPVSFRPRGDAFAMTVKGTAFAERKLAGRALMQEILTLVQLQHENETVIASIGGFDVDVRGRASWSRRLPLHRPCFSAPAPSSKSSFPMTVTPLGAIARLEHALSNFEGEQENYRHRLADARKTPRHLWRAGRRSLRLRRRTRVSSARNSPRSRSILPMDGDQR